jgi:hypothetical protein
VRRRTVDDWRRAVFASRRINDATRVLLLHLADHMRSDRKVSVPRSRIAAALGRSERRITERITSAHGAGFLSTVTAGFRGQTATYQGTFPTAESGTHARPLSTPESRTCTSPLLSAESRPLSTHESGTHGGPTITTADPYPHGTDRDVGSYDEHQERPAAYGITACHWHGWETCPPDCANHEPQEETA